jgi:uncharacterized membrane protein (DUF2068 family)
MEEKMMIPKKKITPIGIKIISVILIIPFTYLFSFYIKSAQTLSLSNDKKVQLLQLEKYKALDINSIEDFDRFLGEELRKATPRLLVVSVIIAILIIGLWKLKKWAWIGVILYSLFAIGWNVVCLFPGASVVKISKLPALITSILVIYYLSRPKVKRLFSWGKQKDGASS